MNENVTILVVDDDEILRQRLEKAFTRRGLNVRTAQDFDSAIETANVFQPERAVLDLKMPGRSGLELLSELLRVSPHTKVVILTGYGSITNAVEAVKLGAINYVTKPADADQVLSAFTHGPSPTPDFPPLRWQKLNGSIFSGCWRIVVETSLKQHVGWIFPGEHFKENSKKCA